LCQANLDIHHCSIIHVTIRLAPQESAIQDILGDYRESNTSLYVVTTSRINISDRTSASDVPGPAWAQSPGLGWASAGLGLPKPKPDPELRAGLGLGLVGLEPGFGVYKLINFIVK